MLARISHVHENRDFPFFSMVVEIVGSDSLWFAKYLEFSFRPICKHLWMKCLVFGWSVFSASLSQAQNDASFFDSFEAPTYREGVSVHGIQKWSVADSETEEGGNIGAQVGLAAGVAVEEEAFEGGQSLKIKAGGKVMRDMLRDGVRFLDVFMLPVYAENDRGTALNAGGGLLVFAKTGSYGRVMAYSGDDNNAFSVGEEYSLDSDQATGTSWVRVTLRIDNKLGKWDLFLDGRPVKASLALGKERIFFQIAAPAEWPVYVDNYRDSAENPLFEDRDGDGMPDAEEKAFGLDPNLNDRDGDLDRDGVQNGDEFFADSSLSSTGIGSGAFVFVDNLNGNDVNTGKTAQFSLGANGPKASIKAAMAAAASGDTIVVMKGRGIYDEGSRSADGKKLIIKTIAPVTIR